MLPRMQGEREQDPRGGLPRTAAERVRLEATEAVQFGLGLTSLLIWLVLTFGVVYALGLVGYGRAAPILLVGALALLVAALPWLAYPSVLAAVIRRRSPRA